jgi:phage FluMu gp28-like protein
VREFLEKIAPIWRPHPGQREFLLSQAPFQVLACGRRWGKTDACAVRTAAALFEPSPTQHLLLAPTLDQASLLFDRTVALLEALGEKVKVRRSPYPRLQLGPHVVTARSGHVPRSLRGHGATDIVVDEAAYLPESLVTEIAMPMLATTGGRLTLISTPHGKNHFWRFFHMGQRGEHGVWSRQAPSSESPFVSAQFLAVQRELVSERAYRVEYEAEFLDGAGQVFRDEAVQKCLVPRPPAARPPYAIGIDWARYGDYTAVAVLSGDRADCGLIELQRFHGTSWSQAVARVADVVSRFPHADVLCDATGVGDPVLEQLRAALPEHKVDGLTFTSAVKAELVDNLAWLFEQGALKMAPDPALLRELQHFQAVPTPGGARLAAGSGAHDDLVVALALAARQLRRRYRARVQVAGPRVFSRGKKG